jgi:hypothetical protein
MGRLFSKVVLESSITFLGSESAMIFARINRAEFLLFLIAALAGMGQCWQFATGQDRPKNALPSPKAISTDKNSENEVPAPKPQPAKESQRHRELIEKMSKVVDIERAIEAPLKDVLEFLSDRFDLTLIINTQAFRALDTPIDNVEEIRVKLPKMPGVALQSVFRLLLSQFNAACVVKRDFVEITTNKAVQDIPKETVSVFAKQRPLAEVFDELAEQTGASIVVDTRAEEKAQTFVRANLQGVSLQTAVRTLANMADLKVVVMDNLLLVTNAENAEQMRREHLRSIIENQGFKALRELETADAKEVPRLREALTEAMKQMKLVAPEVAKPMPNPAPKD